MFLINIFKWLIKPPIIESPFIQHWEGEGINPPPPGSELRITDNASFRITDTGDNNRITD